MFFLHAPGTVCNSSGTEALEACTEMGRPNSLCPFMVFPISSAATGGCRRPGWEWGVYSRFSSWRRMGADKPSSLSVVDSMSVGVSVHASPAAMN